MSDFGFGNDPSRRRAGASGQQTSGFSVAGIPVLDTLSVLTQVGSVALAHEQAEEAEEQRKKRREQLQKQRQERRRQLRRQQAQERRRRKNENESTAGRANRTRGRDLLLGNSDSEDESITETLG